MTHSRKYEFYVYERKSLTSNSERAFKRGKKMKSNIFLKKGNEIDSLVGYTIVIAYAGAMLKGISDIAIFFLI